MHTLDMLCLRFLLSTFIWGLLECKWRGEGLKGIASYVWRFLKVLPALLRIDLTAPPWYTAEWKGVTDGKTLRRNICEFVTAACHRAPRPYGDSRFLVDILMNGVPLGRDSVVRFTLRDLPRLQQEILEEWFPDDLGPWAGKDFEVVVIPIGALWAGVPLRPLSTTTTADAQSDCHL